MHVKIYCNVRLSDVNIITNIVYQHETFFSVLEVFIPWKYWFAKVNMQQKCPQITQKAMEGAYWPSGRTSHVTWNVQYFSRFFSSWLQTLDSVWRAWIVFIWQICCYRKVRHVQECICVAREVKTTFQMFTKYSLYQKKITYSSFVWNFPTSPVLRPYYSLSL